MPFALCGSDPRQARSSQRARAFRVSTRRYSLKIVGGSRLSSKRVHEQSLVERSWGALCFEGLQLLRDGL